MNVAQEFEPLYRAARSLPLGQGPCAAALVTITRTRGSTFRRAGASMLVLPDGHMICELSGGCPQRDIVLRATQVIEHGRAALVGYGRESNYDVMIETGCGGELEVLIEPWRETSDIDFLHAMAKLRAQRQSGAMATVFATDGVVDTPRPRRLVRGSDVWWHDADGTSMRGAMESAMATMRDATADTLRLDIDGRLHDVLLEGIEPPHALLVVGDGLGARLLCDIAVRLGWHATLSTPAATNITLPDGIRHVIATPGALASKVVIDAMTSVVVMTHQLERDLQYLKVLLDSPAPYVGVIGSRQRAGKIRKAFPGAQSRLRVPAGLDVGSETPQEIALAVTAEILALRNGRQGGPLSLSLSSIHA